MEFANSSAIEKSSLNQPIKFDQLINQKINDSLAKNKADPTLKLLSLNQASEIKIVPYSRLSFREKPIVKVNFGLKTQFKNAADNNADTKRLYHYVSKERISLAEWEAQNNLLFMKKADQAFSALSQVFTLDLAIRNGWYVVCDPDADLVPNEFVQVCLKDGRCTIKEFVGINGGVLSLLSVNGGERFFFEMDEVESITAITDIVPPSQHRQEHPYSH